VLSDFVKFSQKNSSHGKITVQFECVTLKLSGKVCGINLRKKCNHWRIDWNDHAAITSSWATG